ncbi:MAG TPA: response regulator [Tepidisphaeraceae bacterium]|nr:response regulator [Tepidisphaeraceae bacterium]
MQVSGYHNHCLSSSSAKKIEDVRVLVVEDEPSLREQLIRALGELGFRATGTSSGELAVRRNEAEPFDIAVLDLSLPGINGIDTLIRLRSSAPNLQGIILTGSATIPAAQAAMRLGVVEFLTKPCHRGELDRRWIGHGGGFQSTCLP